jgi:hypothetical protein
MIMDEPYLARLSHSGIEADEGGDLVLAVAIGCWWIARPKPIPAAFGSY